MTYLLDNVTMAELHQVRIVEGRHDLSSGDQGQSFDSVKIGMLDGHDASVGKQLLGVVVDKLSRKKNTHKIKQCTI